MRVFLLLLVGMAVEIATLVAVGRSVGVLATVGLLILGGIVGSFLLRREGARTMASFSEALRTRRAPHQEVADGVLIAAAGVLIIIPGFVSDVVALFLLFPPTRTASTAGPRPREGWSSTAWSSTSTPTRVRRTSPNWRSTGHPRR